MVGSSSSAIRIVLMFRLHEWYVLCFYVPPKEVMYVILPVFSGVGDFEGDLLSLNVGYVGEVLAA